jgi:hypothetical protein
MDSTSEKFTWSTPMRPAVTPMSASRGTNVVFTNASTSSACSMIGIGWAPASHDIPIEALSISPPEHSRIGPASAVSSTPFSEVIFPAISCARSEVRYRTFSSFHNRSASMSDARSAEVTPSTRSRRRRAKSIRSSQSTLNGPRA